MKILLLDLAVLALVAFVAATAMRPIPTIQRIQPSAPVVADQQVDPAPIPSVPAVAAPVSAPAVVKPPRPKAIGLATWFAAERGGQSSWYSRAGIEFYVAAGPALRALFGRPNGSFYRVNYPVRVCSTTTKICVRARVVDWCGCLGRPGPKDNRLADLSPELFRTLGTPLSRGVQSITITILDK
jgi:hypothetical protein